MAAGIHFNRRVKAMWNTYCSLHVAGGGFTCVKCVCFNIYIFSFLPDSTKNKVGITLWACFPTEGGIKLMYVEYIRSVSLSHFEFSYLSWDLNADLIQNLVDNVLRFFFIPRLIKDLIQSVVDWTDSKTGREEIRADRSIKYKSKTLIFSHSLDFRVR